MRWVSLCTPAGDVEVSFCLAHYEIIQGVPKFTLRIKDNGHIEGGLGDVRINKNLSVRFHTNPIQIWAVAGAGLSPRMVYTLPRGYRIEAYEEPEPAAEKLYNAARRHTITTKAV